MITELAAALSSRLLPPGVRELLRRGEYRRVIVCPDGVLNALPFEFLIEAASNGSSIELPGGIVYAPSASAYAYACSRKRPERIKHALILVGDDRDASLVAEAQRVAVALPCNCAVVSKTAALQEHATPADLLYIASHGAAPGAEDGHTPAGAHGWTIAFDGGVLSAEDFYREHVRLTRGAVVVLSACSVGRVAAGAAHELAGLIHALFYAGASAVLAAKWPVLYESAEAVFQGRLRGCFAPVCPSARLSGRRFGTVAPAQTFAHSWPRRSRRSSYGVLSRCTVAATRAEREWRCEARGQGPVVISLGQRRARGPTWERTLCSR